MSLLAWLRRLANPTTAKARPAAPRRRSRWDLALPRLEALEDRLAPASVINVTVGSNTSGSADAKFTSQNGTLNAIDFSGQVVTLSTGALTSIAATNSISVTAQSSITFPDFATGGGTLALLPGLGQSVTFQTTGSSSSSITFNNATKNTISTGGADIIFSAGTDLNLGGLTVSGSVSSSQIQLSAGTRLTGNLSLGGSASVVGGSATLSASGAIFNAAGTTNNVTANTLSLTAGTAIGSNAAALITAVSAVAAKTTAGDVFINNTGNLTVGFDAADLNNVKGVQSLGGTGNVSVLSAGNVSVNRHGDVVKGIASASVQATGSGSNLLTGGNNTGNTPAITATNGGVTLGAGANILLGDAKLHQAGDVVGKNAPMVLLAGQGITLDEGSTLSAQGTGTVSATAANSIVLQDTSAVGARVLTAGGNISLITTAAGGTFTLNSGAGGTVSMAGGSGTSTGLIAIASDFTNISDPINATSSGAADLTTATAGQVINLGGSTTGQDNLSDSELDQVTALALRVGSNASSPAPLVNNSGGILLTGVITQAGSGYTALDLITSGAITEGGGSFTGSQLALQAGTGIGTGVIALTTVVSNLAFTNAAGLVNVSNATLPLPGQLLTLNSVDTVTASANTGTNTTVLNNGPLTVNANVTGAGDVTLETVKAAGAAADITVNPTFAVKSTGGNLNVESADGVSVPSGATVSDISATPATLTITGGFQNPTSTGGLSLLGTVSVQTPAPGTTPATSAIVASANRDVTLGNLVVGTLAAPTGSISVTSNAGNIHDDGNLATVLAASKFTLTAAKAIGGDTPIARDDVLTKDATFQKAIDLQPGPNPSIVANQTGTGGNLQLRVTTGTFDTRLLGATPTIKGSGNQLALIASGVLLNQVTTAGDLVVDSPLTLPAAANANLLLAATDGNNVQVTVGSITNVGANQGAGSVTMVATSGQVLVSNSVTAGGNVTLAAGGNVSGNGVSVGSTVTTSGGTILVDANRDVTLTAGGHLVTSTTNGRQILVTSAEDLPNSPTTGTGVVNMANGTSLDTSANNSAITVNAGDRLGRGGDATLATLNAGTGNDSVTAFVGNIIDGNGAGTPNVTGGAITLTANGTTGIDSDITTKAPATAGVTATDPFGPISLRSAGQMQVTNVNAGTNNVSLTAGTLTSLHPSDGVADATGGTVSLSATSGTIGTAPSGPIQYFEVAAQTLNASTNGGDMFISAINGTALGSVNAGTNNVTLETVNGNLTLSPTTGTDVVGHVVTLIAIGNAGNASLGSAANPLPVLVINNLGVPGKLEASVSGGGSLNVSGDGDLQVSLATTDGGPVNLGAPGHDLTVLDPATGSGPVIAAAGAAVTIRANNLFTNNTSVHPDVAAATFLPVVTFAVGTAAAPLKTQTNIFTATVSSVYLNNAGPLTLAPLPGSAAALTANGGAVSISAAGDLTVGQTVSAVTDVTLATTTGTSDNLIVGAGQTVTAGHKVTLSAGDALTLQAHSLVQSRTQDAVALLLGTKGNRSSSTIAGALQGGSATATGGAGNNLLSLDFTGGASLGPGLAFDGGSGGSGVLVYSDLNQPVGHTYTLTTAGLSRDGGKQPVTLAHTQALVVVGTVANDVFLVQGTPKGVTTSLYGLGGSNAVFVSSDAPTSLGNLATLGGPLTIDPGAGPSNLLVVSDFSHSGPEDVTLTSSTIATTGGGGFSINYAPTGFFRGNVKLVLGGGNDIARVQGTPAAAVTSLYTLGGNGTVVVSSSRGTLDTLLGTLDIDAGTGAAQLIISEQGAAAADNLLFSANKVVSGTYGFTINYTASGGAFSRGFLYYGGAGSDTVTVNGTTAGAYTYLNTGPGPDQITVNVLGPSGDPLIVDGGDSGAPAGNVVVVNDAAGGAAAFNFPTGPGSGVVRMAYPGGLRDVYYLSTDALFTNPAAS
jgi:hypothetical protein